VQVGHAHLPVAVKGIEYRRAVGAPAAKSGEKRRKGVGLDSLFGCSGAQNEKRGRCFAKPRHLNSRPAPLPFQYEGARHGNVVVGPASIDRMR
jgi:hypothetical protein